MRLVITEGPELHLIEHLLGHGVLTFVFKSGESNVVVELKSLIRSDGPGPKTAVVTGSVFHNTADRSGFIGALARDGKGLFYVEESARLAMPGSTSFP